MTEDTEQPRHLKWLSRDAKNHTVAFAGEFIGTASFLFFAFAGTTLANASQDASVKRPNISSLLYIALSFGFSLMVNAWVFYRVSGSAFNPAVTLAMALLRVITPLRAVLIFIAQLTGACLAAELIKALIPVPFAVQTTLSHGATYTQGVFTEIICTALLIFTILMLAKEKHRATAVAPIGIGLALFITQLAAVYSTGGSLNPARSFGPAAVDYFHSDHWVYWVGPGIGALLAVGVYKFMKFMRYELANPGQDAYFDGFSVV